MADDRDEFAKGLEKLINAYSMENASNTPDFILAGYLNSCLLAFETAVQQRETWYGRNSQPTEPPTERAGVFIEVPER